MRISIVIPFFNEEENVAAVLSEIRQFHPEAQVVAVDDCSSDSTPRLLAEQPDVDVIRLPRRMGQSAAVYRGLIHATGDVVVIMDGDGQCNPADIKKLLAYIPEYDLVNGCRAERQDSFSRRAAARIANGLRNLVTRDGMKDTGGTPKVMKRECVSHLVPFDGVHRFIPALLNQAGCRMLEVPVSHRPRLAGRTKYTNWGRALRGVWDLIGVSWVLRRKLDARDLDVIVCDRTSSAGPKLASEENP